MGNKFSDFLNTDINYKNDTNFNNDKLKNKTNSKNAEELINKYKGLDENELMSELIKESNKEKINGTLDENLNNFSKVILPYLNDEQKQKMNEIINKIK